MIVYELEGGAEEVGEDGCGDGAGAGPSTKLRTGLLTALAGHPSTELRTGETEEGFAGAGDEGEGGGEVLHLVGGFAVPSTRLRAGLHGVEVPPGGSGAGAAAAPSTGLRTGARAG